MALTSPLFVGGFFAVMVLLGATLQHTPRPRDARQKWMFAAALGMMLLGAGAASFGMRLDKELSRLLEGDTPEAEESPARPPRPAHTYPTVYQVTGSDSQGWLAAEDAYREFDRLQTEAARLLEENQQLRRDASGSMEKHAAEIGRMSRLLENGRAELAAMKRRLAWYSNRLGEVSSVSTCSPAATYLATGPSTSNRPLTPIYR